jgi:hypothetical protein
VTSRRIPYVHAGAFLAVACENLFGGKKHQC